MRRFTIRRAGAFAVALLLLPIDTVIAQDPPPAASEQALLQLSPLTPADRIVTASDVADPRVRLFEGMLLRERGLDFSNANQQHILTISGSEVRIELRDEKFVLTVAGQEPQPLQQSPQMGFAPVTLRVGAQKQQEYLLAFPLGFSRGFMGVLWHRSGAVQRGQIGQQAVCLYDDNTDGRYVLGEDGLRVGGDDHPVIVLAPASPLVGTSDRVVQIQQIAEDGSSIGYAEYAGPVGSLSLSNSFSDLEVYAALSSQAAGAAVVAGAQPSASQTFRVAPGEYRLVHGAVFSPQLNRIVALITPGVSTPVGVTADENQSLALGGPLWMTFDINKRGRRGNSIVIDSSTFKITGANGEEYRAYTWSRTKPPEVLVARGETVQSIGKMEFG